MPRRNNHRQRRVQGTGGVANSRSKGSPRWYDNENTKECDHDTDEHEPERVREEVRYSDFGYFRSRCGAPDCEETWDWYIEG